MPFRHLVFLLTATVASTSISAQLSLSDATFIIEEAWRADSTVTQHALSLDDQEWNYSLTGEWASPERDHKIGFTIPVTLDEASSEAFGDLSIDASWQVRGSDRDRFALAPRVSLALPVQTALDGNITPGLSLAIPMTLHHDERTATHWNIRIGWNDLSAENRPVETALGIASVHAIGEHFLAVLESELVVRRDAEPGQPRKTTRELTISAGGRWEIRALRSLGITPGVAVPVTFSEDGARVGLMFHAMLERPFGTSSD